ncbi:MAG: hypothetical protein AB7V42_12700 [Thermoleophilia bacterium]
MSDLSLVLLRPAQDCVRELLRWQIVEELDGECRVEDLVTAVHLGRIYHRLGESGSGLLPDDRAVSMQDVEVIRRAARKERDLARDLLDHWFSEDGNPARDERCIATWRVRAERAEWLLTVLADDFPGLRASEAA